MLATVTLSLFLTEAIRFAQATSMGATALQFSVWYRPFHHRLGPFSKAFRTIRTGLAGYSRRQRRPSSSVGILFGHLNHGGNHPSLAVTDHSAMLRVWKPRSRNGGLSQKDSLACKYSVVGANEHLNLDAHRRTEFIGLSVSPFYPYHW